MELEQKILELQRAFSSERSMNYVKWTGNDLQVAFSLFSYNFLVSRTLLIPLHTLETVLSNFVNEQLKLIWGEKWFLQNEITMRKYQSENVKKVIKKVTEESNSRDFTNFQVVSKLNFGFWTMLFSPKNDFLWNLYLHKIFDNSRPIQRKVISAHLENLRQLRNRVAHYETIIHMDLQSLYNECRILIEMISPIALEWSDSQCNFPEVHPGIPIILNDRVNPELDLNPYRFEKNNFNTKSPSK